MEELQVEQRDQVLVVTIEGIQYEVSMVNAEEAAREWGIPSEMVAQIYALVTHAANCEKHARKLSWNKLIEEYGRILQLMPAEELINRMVDDFGHKLLNPDKWYDAIKMDLERLT